MPKLLHHVVVALCALSFAAPLVQATAESPFWALSGVQIDRAKVLYGDVRKFDPEGEKTVATIRSTEVYQSIPAYQTIQKEGLDRGSARYKKLIREATQTFKAALKKAAGEKSFVLIMEEGGISGYPHVVDATADIIAAL